MLALQSLHPRALLWAIEFRLCLLNQVQVVGSVSLPGGLQLLTRGESLQPVLADRLEHQQPWFLPLLLGLLHQVFVDERGDPVQHVCHSIADSTGYRSYRLQGTPTDEDREAPEEPLLLRTQQIITPLNRIAQRLLPRWHILCSARQHLHPVL